MVWGRLKLPLDLASARQPSGQIQAIKLSSNPPEGLAIDTFSVGSSEYEDRKDFAENP